MIRRSVAATRRTSWHCSLRQAPGPRRAQSARGPRLERVPEWDYSTTRPDGGGCTRVARATLGGVDDPYDLSESAWRARFSRRLAEARSLERASIRTATLLRPPATALPPLFSERTVLTRGRPLTAEQRDRGRRHRWAALDPAARRLIMRRVARCRWPRGPAHEHGPAGREPDGPP
jgi:hypothetical protein